MLILAFIKKIVTYFLIIFYFMDNNKGNEERKKYLEEFHKETLRDAAEASEEGRLGGRLPIFQEPKKSVAPTQEPKKPVSRVVVQDKETEVHPAFKDKKFYAKLQEERNEAAAVLNFRNRGNQDNQGNQGNQGNTGSSR